MDTAASLELRATFTAKRLFLNTYENLLTSRSNTPMYPGIF